MDNAHTKTPQPLAISPHILHFTDPRNTFTDTYGKKKTLHGYKYVPKDTLMICSKI
jgi:hypothetical protein